MVVGIIGLGLMGGSFAKRTRELRLFKEFLGYDHNKRHQEEALGLGLVDRFVSFEELLRCDVIILAIPVDGIIEVLQRIKRLDEKTLIIDFGSTKEVIVNATPKAIRQNLVATHPMAGTEYNGPKAALSNLYEDKTVVFCDIDESGAHQYALAKEIFEALNMNIIYMSAQEQDRHSAFISHLPHAMSFSLANTVLNQEEPKNILLLASGGFASTSRLAKSSPKMWVDIFKQNKENVLETITAFKGELKIMKELIEEERFEELEAWIKKANKLQEIL